MRLLTWLVLAAAFFLLVQGLLALRFGYRMPVGDKVVKDAEIYSIFAGGVVFGVWALMRTIWRPKK
ncbi:MAG: hypothetical protein K8T91_02020 [Planctomycetes bacterium]|nr:hypothetical protein [Planctomycetota bacterium]